MKLILGSKSPRRAEILEHLSIPFHIRSNNSDESQITNSIPHERVELLSEFKSQGITIANDEILLTSDTIVTINGEILEKPSDKEEAHQMIKKLSGNTHEVLTSFTLRTKDCLVTETVTTSVTFFELSETEIKDYLETDEPYDKAGGYGIQSYGARFVSEIKGDYYSVVGLPIGRVLRKLREFGFEEV